MTLYALLRHAFFDNPILTKHIRSRLRRGQLLAPVVIVAMLALLIAWGGFVTNHVTDGGVARFAATLQGVVLVFMGLAQVSVSLSRARESGILDFHRISPLPPHVTTLGFFLGAPVREYLLALIPIPLLLISIATGGITLGELLQWELALLLIAWLFHTAALLSALISRRPIRGGGGTILVLLGLFAFGNVTQWLARSLSPSVDPDQPLTLRFFNLNLPWVAWLALYSIPLIGFGLLATTRKMHSARAHLLSKPQAVAFLVIATILILGMVPRSLWENESLLALYLYLLGGAGILASLPIVPRLGEYTRGLRRAARAKHAHVPIWDDLALNRPVLFVLCAIVLLGGSYLYWLHDDRNRPPHFSQAVAVTVLTVAYVGLAHQYWALKAPNQLAASLGLFLFVLWVMPLLAATILQIAGVEGLLRDILFGLSPLSAIAAIGVGRPGQSPAPEALRLAALVPAISLPLLFNNLLTIARRQIDASVRDGSPAGPSPRDTDLVEANA